MQYGKKTFFRKVKALDNPWFMNLTDGWSDLTNDTYQSLDIKVLSESNEQSQKLLKKILTSENIPWAAYLEGAELTIILSSGGPPEVSTRAIHKAKWMA